MPRTQNSGQAQALRIRTREQVPLDWAISKHNLGTALLRMGERDAGTSRLEEAAAELRSALDAFVQTHADRYRTITETHLDQAETTLRARRGKTTS